MSGDELSGDQIGLDMLRRIGGESWDSAVRPLAEISPDMARLTIDFAYGQVLSRLGLDLFTRQCCTIATLLVNGSATRQLKFHLLGLLNVGGTVEDAVELFTVATAMIGFPAAIGSIGVLREIVAERAVERTSIDEAAVHDRWAKGLASMRELTSCSPQEYAASSRGLAPDFERLTVTFQFGEVLGRPGLADHVRQLVVISILAASGNRAELLRQHIGGALSRGLTRDAIEEALIQLAVYAGFPTALNAFAAFRQVEPAASAETDMEPAETWLETVDRRTLGLTTLAATSGTSGETVINGFDDLAPAIGAMIVDHAYGEIFSDQRLDAKTRELAAVATIASRMAEIDEGPLTVHIAAALNLGATQDEIVQVLTNVAPYRGYPTVQKAMASAMAALQKAGHCR